MLAVVVMLVALPEGARLDVGVGSLAPVYFGGQAVLELPGRILLSGELGYMPHAYVSVNNFFHDDGFDNDFVNDGRKGGFVRSTVRDALVLRPSIGMRPLAYSSIEVMIGYTHIAALSRESTGSRSFQPNIDAFHVALARAWQATPVFVLRTSIGWMFPIHVSTGERADHPDPQDLYGRTDPAAQYKNVFRSPTLSFMFCYRFD